MQRILRHKWFTTSCTVFCIGWLIEGCSGATGPYFRPAEHLAPHQTMVYLYFPKQSGYFDSYTILANGTIVTRLDEGGYYLARASQGRMTFSLSGEPETQNLTIIGEGGHTYFVKVVLVEVRRLLRGEKRFYQLFLTPEELAYAELSSLRLMATCHTTEGCALSLK